MIVEPSMNRIEVERFLERLGTLRALVVGDLMLDEYLWGRTERISPEAPVQVVDVLREEIRPGGAGNVIHNLSALGCRLSVASVLGDDADGRRVVAMLAEKGIGTEGVLRTSDRTTSRKTRVLASNQQMMRIDRESCEPISSEHEAQLAAYVRKVAPEFQVILISDYLKGVLTPGLIQAVIAVGQRARNPRCRGPQGGRTLQSTGARPC